MRYILSAKHIVLPYAENIRAFFARDRDDDDDDIANCSRTKESPTKGTGGLELGDTELQLWGFQPGHYLTLVSPIEERPMRRQASEIGAFPRLPTSPRLRDAIIYSS